MAFNPDLHEMDPKTGLIVHKDTGFPVGLAPRDTIVATADAVVAAVHEAKAADPTYPKWVLVHASHIVREDGKAPVVQTFDHFHVNRDGSVMVMVEDEAEEHRATSDHVDHPLASAADLTAVYDRLEQADRELAEKLASSLDPLGTIKGN